MQANRTHEDGQTVGRRFIATPDGRTLVLSRMLPGKAASLTVRSRKDRPEAVVALPAAELQHLAAAIREFLT
jgi:hypothetical protein